MLKLLKTTGILTLAGTLAVPAAFAATTPAVYQEGVNYVRVVPMQPVNVDPGEVQVLDFFWYGSPRCAELEPYLQSWADHKPQDVVLTRVPAALNPQWDLDARAYYTAVQLGVAGRVDAAVYAAVNTRHQSFTNVTDYERLFTSELGISPAKFAAAWNSLNVDTALENAKVLAQRYGVTRVPTLAVDGAWLTGAGYKLATPQIMNAVSWLVQRELAVQPAGTP